MVSEGTTLEQTKSKLVSKQAMINMRFSLILTIYPVGFKNPLKKKLKKTK